MEKWYDEEHPDDSKGILGAIFYVYGSFVFLFSCLKNRITCMYYDSKERKK